MSAAADVLREDLPSEIRGLLVPLSGAQLLLPNAMVAEVVNYQAPQPIDDVPGWLKGYVGWRGEIVPLVSVERLLGLAETAAGHRARIVVCTALERNARLSYVGLMARAIPRLIRVTSSNLAAVDGDTQVFGILARLTVDGEPAVMLDVDGLESELVNVLPG